jgi:hypothetical protein
MELIYCGGGNRRFYEIATTYGFRYGSNLPETIYGPIYFADQNWKNPNREAYMNALSLHRPFMATVLDWEYEEQLPEVLSWAEEAAQYVEEILIIPKVHGGIKQLPRFIGNRPIRLAYSVPTKFGGSDLFLSEFIGWPVHLLGGSPRKQKEISNYLDVHSVDGNMAMKMATSRCTFFDPTQKTGKGYWSSILAFDGKRWENDAPYEAFRRSCLNIMQFWKE